MCQVLEKYLPIFWIFFLSICCKKFLFVVGECNLDHGLWKTCGGRTCIYKEFFRDGKLNCPYKSCKDENGCQVVTSVLNGKYDLLINYEICTQNFQIL